MSRWRFVLIVAGALGVFAVVRGPACAATATLVRDLNGQTRALGSYPRDFLALGARTLFVASTPQQDDEPWVTDGTPAGTRLLKDLEPGPDGPELGGVRCAATLDDVALLLSPSSTPSADGGRTFALWRSDGTPAATVEVAAIPGEGACVMAALGDRVVFALQRRLPDLSWTFELWTTDATASGTQRLAAFPAADASFSRLQRAGELVFFAPRTENGVELWRTDGSAAGTVRVADVRPADLPPTAFLGSVGELLIFEGTDGTGEPSLWRSDGTADGTFPLVASPPYGYFSPLSHAGRLLLASTDHVLITDGSGGGTARRPLGSGLRALASVGTSVFILSQRPDGLSTLLSRWDDLAGEPTLVAEIPGSYIGHLAALPDALLFAVSDADGSRALWRSDGTPGGTVQLLSGGDGFGAFDTLAANGPRAYFGYERGQNFEELWTSDGTVAGTVQLANIGPDDVYSDSSDPRDLTAVGGRLFFSADAHDGHGSQLWSSDGTPGGTAWLREIDPRWDERVVTRSIGAIDGILFIEVDSTRPDVPSGLWRTDGTATGTFPVAALESSGVETVVKAGDTLYFSTSGAAVCRAGASETDVSCAQLQAVGEIHALGERVILAGGTQLDLEPWVSDGTEAGTRLIEDLATERGGSMPRDFTTAADEVFFSASRGAQGTSLYHTDGNARSISIDLTSAGGLYALTSVGDRLFFVTGDFYEPGLLWHGRSHDFQPVAGVFPTAAFLPGRRMPRLGGAVLFQAADDEHGGELWISDGTPAGTRLVRDLYPGPQSSTPYGFLELGDRIAFAACTDNGCEPWITDGTAAGTHQLADIARGIASSDPSPPVAVGGVLYLAANDHVHGFEVWRITLDDICAGDCGGDGTVTVADAITAVAIALGTRPAGDCAAADLDASGTVTIDEIVAAVRAALEGCV